MAEPKLVDAPVTLWRVGRHPNPLNFSRLTATDAENPRGGNRFDVPGGGVLYAATRPQGAYAETLARFRPSAAMRKLRHEADEHLMEAGAVPADWRTRRRLVNFTLHAPLPFIDVDHPATHTALMRALSTELTALGHDELDIAALRGKDRLLTRAIAKWAFTQTDDDGNPCYAGIRYQSRLGDYECWAVFDGAEIINSNPQVLSKTDRELLEIARIFDLSIH
ncbi:RES family NAD+ phosphorylase [Nesterenkonia flava]|uniref:RES family NAD+ phosphorylase n=1 Tax=Nesterenkonia flava TaxID=469799 RepID=A0ABU1FTG5_9MICC|nr:RES family NAD+ phosphorylase [Nesterenkonia flava]MDR5711955.1 RES family NAD+ phosphorylase [Nesterenkonia flava]